MVQASDGADRYFRGPIEATIEQFAQERGGRLVRNVVISIDDYTADLPYLLIDRHGFLLLDIKVWPGLQLSGSEDKPQWIAASSDGGRTRIPNPLTVSEFRLETLRRALAACGRSVGPEYFGDLVIHAGADVSSLRLEDTTTLNRFIDASELRAALGARFDFAANPGAIEDRERDDFVSLLGLLDRSDSTVQAAQAGKTKGPAAGLFGLGAKEPTTIGISDSAAGIAPPPPHRTAERYPTIQATRSRKSLVPLVALLLVLLVGLFWKLGTVQSVVLLSQPLVLGVQDLLHKQPSTATGLAEDSRAPAVGQAVSMRVAKRVFRTYDPETYKFVTNRDAPAMSRNGEFTTYTWDYTDTTPGAERSGTVALTFDSTGKLRGVDR